MRRTILQLAAVLAVILFSSPVDAQHCGCKLGRLFGGGGFGGAYGLSAGYGGAMDNCGRGITQSQAAALWSGYCTDSCSFDSSCGSFGGNSYAAPCATDNCNTGCASVGHSSGYVGGYAASSIVDDCYGDYSGGCFGGGRGGCKIKGLFRGLFGKLNGLGCGGGCGFGYGGGCGMGHGCGGGCGLGAGGGLLGRFGGGSGCFGGCFGYPSGGCGCGVSGRLFGGLGHGHFGGFHGGCGHTRGCGILGRFKSKLGGCCLFSKFRGRQQFATSQQYCGTTNAYFTELVGYDYGTAGMQSCVAGTVNDVTATPAMNSVVPTSTLPAANYGNGGYLVPSSCPNAPVVAPTHGMEIPGQAIGGQSVVGDHGNANNPIQGLQNSAEALKNAIDN